MSLPRALVLLALVFVLPCCTTLPRGRALAPLAAQLAAVDAAARDYAQSPLLNARLMPAEREPGLVAEAAVRTKQADDVIALRAALSEYLISLALLAGEPVPPASDGPRQLAGALTSAGLIAPASGAAATRLSAAAERAASAAYRAHALTEIAGENHQHVATLASGLESIITANFAQSLDIEAAVIAAWSAANTAGGAGETPLAPIAPLTRERTGALTAEVTLRRALAARAAALLREVVTAHAQVAGVANVAGVAQGAKTTR